MVECPKCKNQYKDHITYCVFCGLDLVPVAEKVVSDPVYHREVERSFFTEAKPPVSAVQHTKTIKPGSPPLSAVFALLGVCSLFGGFAYAIHLWPETYTMVYGIFPSSACFPSFTAFLMGIIACCMCFAMAQIISSLKALEYIICQIASKE
ncbi:MAG TPA: hypothetical protein VEC37_06400 [Bacillota bacterium]|nr:hypothetical protein [Bacillota bacterium]